MKKKFFLIKKNEILTFIIVVNIVLDMIPDLVYPSRGDLIIIEQSHQRFQIRRVVEMPVEFHLEVVDLFLKFFFIFKLLETINF